MKIAIFSDTYEPEINGVVTSTFTMKVKLEGMGHKVIIVCPKTKEGSESSDDVWRLRSVAFPFQKEFRMALPMSRKLKNFDQNVDIIHIQTPFFMGHLGQYLGWKYKLPVVHTYHTFWEEYLHYFPVVPKKLRNKVNLLLLTRNFPNRCSHIISPTQTIHDKLIEYGVTKPITTIPTGIDLVKIKDTSVDIAGFRQRYSINDDQPICTFVGRLGPEKNILFLIEAFKTVLKKVPNAVIMIIGDGPQRSELEAEITRLGIDESVRMTGYLTHCQVFEHYLASTCVVSASKTETQGLGLLEGLACGLPAVCIHAIGFKDVLTGNKGGFLTKDCLTDFSDHVTQLLTDKALYKEKKEEALSISANSSSQAMVDKIAAIYESLYKK